MENTQEETVDNVHLTLTRVVFELHLIHSFRYTHYNLTLTRVVFEFCICVSGELNIAFNFNKSCI